MEKSPASAAPPASIPPPRLIINRPAHASKLRLMGYIADQSLSKQPVPLPRLKEIALDACETTLGSVTSYNHKNTESWNTNIINTILQGVTTHPPPGTPAPNYKYAVNSTIIQHLSRPTTTSTSTSTGTQPTTPGPSTSTTTGANEATATSETQPVPGSAGDERTTTITTRPPPAGGSDHVQRRGMHSATGAFWNNATDGLWSWKYEGGEAKGMDVVICVWWIAY